MGQSDADKQLEFAWKVHGYMNEYIRFADPKAGVGLAIVAGLVATLFGSKAHQFCHPERLWFRAGFDWEATLIGVASAAAFGLLLYSAGLFVFSINPRLWKKSRKESGTAAPIPAGPSGHIFWLDVLSHPSSQAYVASLNALPPDKQAEEVARHVYVLADVAERKFRLVKRGVWVGALGAVFTLVALFFIRA